MNIQLIKQTCKKYFIKNAFTKKIYNTIYKNKMNNRKFIKFAHQLLLQRFPSEEELIHWLKALKQGLDPMKLMDGLLESPEFAQLAFKNKRFSSHYLPHPIQNPMNHSSEKEDQLDNMSFINLEDNWSKFEEIISKQHAEGSLDINHNLKTLYLNQEREEAFNRFKNSYEFYYIHHLLKTLRIETDKQFCEVGGGAGYLAWALLKSGYQKMDLFEPNPSWTSGVGYLKSRDDIQGMQIYSDLPTWHTNKKLYDVIITKACLHHFGNISQVAASIRQKMKMNGKWVALREQFSDTPKELAKLLKDHDYCQPFNLYEWAYPAATYVEALEMVGLRLVAIVPAFYGNDCIGTNLENKQTQDSLAFTAEIDQLLQTNPQVTVERFWEEHHIRRKNPTIPVQYTRPQAMIFEKILIN